MKIIDRLVGSFYHRMRKRKIVCGIVVVKDIPSDCIAGVNPCKVVKYLK